MFLFRSFSCFRQVTAPSFAELFVLAWSKPRLFMLASVLSVLPYNVCQSSQLFRPYRLDSIDSASLPRPNSVGVPLRLPCVWTLANYAHKAGPFSKACPPVKSGPTCVCDLFPPLAMKFEEAGLKLLLQAETNHQHPFHELVRKRFTCVILILHACLCN